MKLLTIFALIAATTTTLSAIPSGFSSRMPIIVHTKSGTGAGVSSTQTNFPLSIRLNSAQADIFAGTKPNGADIRFVKASSGTPLHHQIESGKIDEVCMANSARSSDWLKLCFQNQRLSGQSLVTLGASQPLNSRTMPALNRVREAITTPSVNVLIKVTRSVEENTWYPSIDE